MVHGKRTTAAVVMALGLALTTTACGSGNGNTTEPATPSSSAASTAASSTPSATTGDAMRDAIIKAMTGTSPTLVGLAKDPATVLRILPVSALAGWKVVDLTLDAPPHPRRSYVGVSDQGEVVILSNNAGNFSTMAKGAEVTTEEQAKEVAAALVESTRDASRLAYPVSSMDDFRWLPTMNADQKAVKDAVTKNQGSTITAPTATAADGGWTVVSWWVQAEQLVRHETAIAADGTVSDTATVEAPTLPVVIGR